VSGLLSLWSRRGAQDHDRRRSVGRRPNNRFASTQAPALGRYLPNGIANDSAAVGHEPPVGVAMEFSGKPPLTRRPAIHAAAGHSANSPQPRDLIPATNCGRRSVPPTLIPNAAMRGTGDRHGGRARGRGRAQRAQKSRPSRPRTADSACSAPLWAITSVETAKRNPIDSRRSPW